MFSSIAPAYLIFWLGISGAPAVIPMESLKICEHQASLIKLKQLEVVRRNEAKKRRAGITTISEGPPRVYCVKAK